MYISIRRPLQSVERVRLHLLAYNIQPFSISHPSKQGPEEDMSPASPGSQAAEIEECYPPGTQAAGIQDLGASMLKSRDLIILSSSIGDLLCRHRLPQAANILAQNPANLPKSVLPPAQECQIAPLGTLATPVEPKWHQGLAADTRGGQRPPKCDSNSSQICHRASQKTSIQASKHPRLGAQRSAAEAVAFSIYDIRRAVR